MALSAIMYLKQQLGFASSEWVALSEEDKTWYKNAALEEMAVMGIAGA